MKYASIEPTTASSTNGTIDRRWIGAWRLSVYRALTKELSIMSSSLSIYVWQQEGCHFFVISRTHTSHEPITEAHEKRNPDFPGTTASLSMSGHGSLRKPCLLHFDTLRLLKYQQCGILTRRLQ